MQADQPSLFSMLPLPAVPEAKPEREHAGYRPGHCWYWYQGGEPVPVDEIPPCKPFQAIALNQWGKPDPPLERQLAGARAELARDVAKYELLLAEKDAACSEYDLRNGYNWQFNASLKYNHIRNDLGRILELEQAIARYGFQR